MMLPSRSVMRVMYIGFMRSPWLAKLAKAAVMSDSVASPAPMASGR